MNMLDLIYHHDQWGMRQNHADRRNNNKLDDPNLLLIPVGHEAESCRPQYNNKIMGKHIFQPIFTSTISWRELFVKALDIG